MTLTPIEGALKIISLYKSEIASKSSEGYPSIGVKSVIVMLDEIEELLRR